MGERANRRFSPCGTFGGASRALTKVFHARGDRTKWSWSARSISACVHVESTMYSVRLALRRAAPALMRLAWRVVARIWNLRFGRLVFRGVWHMLPVLIVRLLYACGTSDQACLDH